MTPLFAFGFSTTQLVIIAIIGVLLFGNRLPKVARSLGSSITEFKKGVSGLGGELNDIKDQVQDAADKTNQTLRS